MSDLFGCRLSPSRRDIGPPPDLDLQRESACFVLRADYLMAVLQLLKAR